METPRLRISEVARRTGLSIETIRSWQRRHRLPAPERTEGGHRLFSLRDVELLSAVRHLRDQGWTLTSAIDFVREADLDQLRDILDHGTPSSLGTPRAQTRDRPELDRRMTPLERDLVIIQKRALQQIEHVERAAEVRTTIVDLVRAVGGAVDPDAGSEAVMKIEFGGVDEPVLVHADLFSATRLRLNAILPEVLELSADRVRELE